jgi:hypothetical protein
MPVLFLESTALAFAIADPGFREHNTSPICMSQASWGWHALRHTLNPTSAS